MNEVATSGYNLEDANDIDNEITIAATNLQTASTMNEVATSGYNLEDANDIDNEITIAATNLQTASLCLRMSYIIRKENLNLSKIRTGVYKRARLYNDTIMPFGRSTVEIIKDFCEYFVEEDYNAFKGSLKYKVDDAKVNMQVCIFAKLFHRAILIKFKKIQDKTITLKLDMRLDDREYNERINSLISPEGDRLSAIRSIIMPIIKGSRKGGSLEDFAAIDATCFLSESINMYVEALAKVAGFFENLFSDLLAINNKLNGGQDDDGELKYRHTLILKNARRIKQSCNDYIGKIPDCATNVQCIVEEYDQYYGKKWMTKVVEKAKLEKEFGMLKDKRPYLIKV